MARSFAALEVKGLKEVLSRLNNVPKEVAKEIDLELQASARVIVREAKANVRGRVKNENGALLNAISYEHKGDMSYEVVAQKFYAPFVEFGTGTRVNVPAGLEEYAMQFYRGPGVNIPATPYLFPAYEEERKKLIDRLKNIIKTI